MCGTTNHVIPVASSHLLGEDRGLLCSPCVHWTGSGLTRHSLGFTHTHSSCKAPPVSISCDEVAEVLSSPGLHCRGVMPSAQRPFSPSTLWAWDAAVQPPGQRPSHSDYPLIACCTHRSIRVSLYTQTPPALWPCDTVLAGPGWP